MEKFSVVLKFLAEEESTFFSAEMNCLLRPATRGWLLWKPYSALE